MIDKNSGRALLIDHEFADLFPLTFELEYIKISHFDLVNFLVKGF